MQRERISDDIFVFTSGMYAQVTAGAVLTSEGAVIIDTLPFPSEPDRWSSSSPSAAATASVTLS